MAKITLHELDVLSKEIIGFEHEGQIFEGILSKDIPFPLKFKIQSKFIPQIEAGLRLFNEKVKELAGNNGANISDKGYQFTTDSEGKVVNKDAFDNFSRELLALRNSDANAIEIEGALKISLFQGLKDTSHYPVLCKFIEDDM